MQNVNFELSRPPADDFTEVSHNAASNKITLVQVARDNQKSPSNYRHVYEHLKVKNTLQLEPNSSVLT